MSELRPDSCSSCQEPCSLHVTQVANGKAVKIGLCAACPMAQAVAAGSGYDLVAALAPGKAEKPALLPPASQVSCPDCGFTAEAFKERGRLGCPRCYEVFGPRLEGIFGQIQRGSQHVGKAPRRFRSSVAPKLLAELREKLQRHIAREEYEDAATLRDRIRELEQA